MAAHQGALPAAAGAPPYTAEGSGPEASAAARSASSASMLSNTPPCSAGSHRKRAWRARPLPSLAPLTPRRSPGAPHGSSREKSRRFEHHISAEQPRATNADARAACVCAASLGHMEAARRLALTTAAAGLKRGAHLVAPHALLQRAEALGRLQQRRQPRLAHQRASVFPGGGRQRYAVRRRAATLFCQAAPGLHPHGGASHDRSNGMRTDHAHAPSICVTECQSL